MTTPWIVRPDDLVVLKFEFTNLVLDGDKRKLVRQVPAAPGSSVITVTFQPQHVAEQVYPLDTPAATVPTPSRISGLTRIAFTEPDVFVPVSYTLRGLLEACAQWKVKVSAKASQPLVINPNIIRQAHDIHHILTSTNIPNPPGIARHFEMNESALSELHNAFAGVNPTGLPHDTLDSNSIIQHFEFDKAALEALQRALRGIPLMPATDETSIEIPYRLLMSPPSYARWSHTFAPYEQNGRTECWSTSLSEGKVLFALYTRDKSFSSVSFPTESFSDVTAGSPFTGSLTADNRGRIVHNTTDSSDAYQRLGSTPRPVNVDVLNLSSLGGTLVLRGDWPVPKTGLTAWKHRALLGRDHEVQVSEPGNLLPFGHRAILVRTTRRSIFSDGMAALESFSRIVVLETTRTYSNEFSDTSNVQLRRLNPLRRVEYLQLSTTDIIPEPTEDQQIVSLSQTLSAVITDCQSHQIRTQVPVVFVRSRSQSNTGITTLAFQPSSIGNVTLNINERLSFVEASDASGTHFAQDINFFARRIGDDFVPVMRSANVVIEALSSFPTSGPVQGPLAFSYDSQYINSGLGSAANPGEIYLSLSDNVSALPQIDFSQGSDKSGGFIQPSVALKGLSKKLGIVSSSGSDTGIDLSTLLGQCKLFGILPLASLLPKGDITQVPSFITRSMDKVRRFAYDLQELQKRIEDCNIRDTSVDDAVKNIQELVPYITNLDAASVASHVDSFINSLSKLSDYIGNGTISGQLKLLQMRIAQLRQSLQDIHNIIAGIEQLKNGAELAKDLHVHLTWQPDIKVTSDSPGIIKKVFYTNDSQCRLLLSADARAKTHGSTSAGLDVFCSIENFTLMLVNWSENLRPSILDIPITLNFKHMQFTAGPQKKPDISVVIGDLHFGGPLSFVETLRNIIPLDGFSDPPNLQVDTNGIKAGFSVGLPNVAIGVFSLENISLVAELVVPFLGDTPLHFDFAFCTPEHPFLLTVAFLGGGGYFHVRLDPHNGIDALEAALEFGAHLSIDLGVASGSVSVMAGIYFGMIDKEVTEAGETKEIKEVILSGFLRIRGEVDVLGLISASIELRMSLTWVITTKEVIGQALIIVEVHIAFFSKSVEISAERRFAGSNSDPTFEDVLLKEGEYDPWTEYCLAFAVN